MRWLSIVLLSTLLYSCSEERSWPNEKFDQQLWKTTAEGERHRFARDLIASKILIGKTKPEVVALLGAPAQPEGNDLRYLIKVGGNGFDQVFILDIRFEHKLVKDVFIRGD